MYNEVEKTMFDIILLINTLVLVICWVGSGVEVPHSMLELDIYDQ